MFDKIVVPTDGSELAEKAVDFAIEYCRRTGATMTAVHVRSPTADHGSGELERLRIGSGPGTYTRDDHRAHGGPRARTARGVAQRARAQGVECATVLAVNDQPYLAIIEAAEQQGCSMIFMSSHGRGGIEALLLGSVTQKVLTHSKIPVLVFR